MNKKHLILGIVVILIDQLVKLFMIDKYITIIPDFFKFTYTKNIGAAFGVGSPGIILVINIILIISIFVIVIMNKDKIKYNTPIVFILSGGISNLIDRIFRGYVIDYIDLNIFNFPNFNIADICIVLGIICLLLLKLKNMPNQCNLE